MNLNLFIYDFLCNFLPGSIIVYSLFLKFQISLSGIKSVGYLNKDIILLIIFLLISYLIGNYLNLFTRFICKIINKDKDKNTDINLNYEIYKNTIRVSNNHLLEKIEIFEAKYLFFRNLALAFAFLIFLNSLDAPTILKFLDRPTILILLGIIICLLKFNKYWNLSGKIVKDIYDELKKQEEKTNK